eukprot:COSAG06_NODE_193_length_20595_cov_74.920765_12_plen_109_part_00
MPILTGSKSSAGPTRRLSWCIKVYHNTFATPVDGKLPYNKVDAIAMEHDRAYGAATSYKDIDNADRAFVRQMQTQPGLVAPFSQEEAVAALDACNGDVDMAVAMLLGD